MITLLDGGAATVVVERREGQGWRPAWRGALRDDVGQGSALLADDGRLLVFGDAAADGDHAMLLHDARGRVVRELDLGDFLPAAYVQAIPRGDGGLQWRREAKFARGQARVEFSVPTPGSAAGATGPALRFSIDLRDGAVRTAQIREYLAAAGRARQFGAVAASPTRERGSPTLASGGTPLPDTSISR